MDAVPLIASFVALAVSLFTFWWINVREKRAFYLVRLERIAGRETIDFALLNAGKKDVLVSEIHVYLEGAKVGTRVYPAAELETGGDVGVVASGKAVVIRVRFAGLISPDYIKDNGRRQPPFVHLLSFTAYVEVRWLDAQGVVRVAHVAHSILGFEPTGQPKASAPFSERSARHELHIAAAAA